MLAFAAAARGADAGVAAVGTTARRLIDLLDHCRAAEAMAGAVLPAGALEAAPPRTLRFAAGLPAEAGATARDRAAAWFDGATIHLVTRDGWGEGLAAAVRHESVHRVTHGLGLPAWLDEGLAECAADAALADGALSLDPPAWRARRLRARLAAGELAPLAAFLAMDRAAWQRRVMLRDYDQAWGLCLYLLSGEGGAHRDGVRRYIAAIAAGRSPEDAFAEALPAPAALDAAWRRWWGGDGGL